MNTAIHTAMTATLPFPPFGLLDNDDADWVVPAAERRRRREMRVISITSGKGGVGKSNVVANLAVALSRLGHKVLVIDADLGLGNINILLGLVPEFTLNDVFRGTKSLAEIMMEGPGGIKLIPAGTGIQDFLLLGPDERLRLLDELDSLEDDFDTVLIDTESGISSNVVYFASAAREIVVVVSPEPTSIADGYALIKLLATTRSERHFKVLVNMARDRDDGFQAFSRLAAVTSRFLDISITYLGCVMRDERLVDSVKRQKTVCESYPDSAASRCFGEVADKIAGSPSDPRLKGNIQFLFKRMVSSGAELRHS
jgi:flagellar biosynthesis protein FlhG